jgi:hypothetical protein
MRSTLFRRLRSHRFFPIGVITLALLVAAWVHIWQRVMVIELAKEVAALRIENRSLVDDAKKIRSEIVALSMASRVERYAADSLGLQPVSVDRLVTLVKDAEKDISADELAVMFSSIRRVADYLPVLTEAQASSRDLRPIRFDTLKSEEVAR